MTKPVAVVDIFSGPGGLAEGFSSCYEHEQQRYHIALSIEKEDAAYETLRLRAFLRKFGKSFPKEYYDFLNAETPEPNWARLYPKQWNAAVQETKKIILGKKGTETALFYKYLAKVRSQYGKRTVLIGGPPCQAYSLAGRSRIASADLDKDKRIRLYRQYVNVLEKLQPAVAVLENVKGILSSKVGEKGIFAQVSKALRHAGGRNNYRLFALTPSSDNYLTNGRLVPNDFVVRAEDYGIPQARHRVFVICLRHDIAERLPVGLIPSLKKQTRRVSVDDVLGAMPKLRSGLSKGDSSAAWQKAVRNACQLISRSSLELPWGGKQKFLSTLAHTRKALTNGPILPREVSDGTMLQVSCPSNLKKWLQDKKLAKLPNNNTRGHMVSDLARYIFASIYSDVFDRSPKTMDFPSALAPNHKSWKSGNFSDRYRVQLSGYPSSTITSHISRDGHYFIHPDAVQCRSLTVREAARLQTFPDNYFFKGSRTEQYVQVGNAVPPYLAHQIAESIWPIFEYHSHRRNR